MIVGAPAAAANVSPAASGIETTSGGGPATDAIILSGAGDDTVFG